MDVFSVIITHVDDVLTLQNVYCVHQMLQKYVAAKNEIILHTTPTETFFTCCRNIKKITFHLITDKTLDLVSKMIFEKIEFVNVRCTEELFAKIKLLRTSRMIFNGCDIFPNCSLQGVNIAHIRFCNMELEIIQVINACIQSKIKILQIEDVTCIPILPVPSIIAKYRYWTTYVAPTEMRDSLERVEIVNCSMTHNILPSALRYLQKCASITDFAFVGNGQHIEIENVTLPASLERLDLRGNYVSGVYAGKIDLIMDTRV